MSARRILLAATLLAAGCASNPEPVAPVATVAPVRPAPAPVVAPAPAPVPAPLPVTPEPSVAPAPAVADTPSAVQPPKETLQAYLDGLKAVSCPEGVKRTAAESIELKVSKVPLSMLNPAQKRVGDLTFVGGFHLTSPDKRFGGLSGLDVLPDGNLLAVSDQGDFVWIDLGKDGAPSAARISAMQDAAGSPLRGKADGDSEGLAVHPGGWALVSYERNDRVLAFDLPDCGSNARGAPIVYGGYSGPLRDAYRKAGIEVGENSGPEPLAVTPDWFLLTGLETLKEGRGPLSVRPIEAAPQFDLSVERNAPAFVGLDVIAAGRTGDDMRAFSIHRGFDQILGNAITISETVLERRLDQTNLARKRGTDIEERSHERFAVKSSRRLASLTILQTIDNYESVAAKEMGGVVRLYVISDDNFSASQRTLLMVFDLKP